MLTTVSVVVILGAIIATIARAVLAGDGQPPTTDQRAGRAGPADGGAHAAPVAPATAGDIELVAADDVRVEDRPAVPVVLDSSIPWWRRAQSIVLLTLLVTALGVVAAALLAILVVGGASLLDSALG